MALADVARILRSRWNHLAQAASVVFVVLSGFVLRPPLGADRDDSLLWFGRFLIAAIIGLLFVPMSRWNQRKATWGWWIVALLLLAASTASLIRYRQLRTEWSVGNGGGRVIVGQTPLPEPRRWRDSIAAATGRTMSDSALLMEYVVRADVWDAGEIQRRERVLAGQYLACLALFTITVVSLVQATYCQTRPAGRRSSGRRPRKRTPTGNAGGAP